MRPRNLSLHHARRAFTRIELLATGAAFLLIVVAVVPALAVDQRDSGRAICFNNLRRIGRAVQTWAADHNQQFSWRTPVGNWGAPGGTMPESGVKPGLAWFEFFSLSNELATPKILACPSDAGVRTARSFFHEPEGFPSISYRNNALSYSLHLDGAIDQGRSWLSVDRNLRSNPGFSACSARVNTAETIDTYAGVFSQLAWTNAVHGLFGHVLTTDGAVEFTATPRLRELLLAPQGEDNGVNHYLKAR